MQEVTVHGGDLPGLSISCDLQGHSVPYSIEHRHAHSTLAIQHRHERRSVNASPCSKRRDTGLSACIAHSLQYSRDFGIILLDRCYALTQLCQRLWCRTTSPKQTGQGSMCHACRLGHPAYTKCPAGLDDVIPDTDVAPPSIHTNSSSDIALSIGQVEDAGLRQPIVKSSVCASCRTDGGCTCSF